ncbi:hypothetical protein KTI87_03100 [Acinetobacter nosocomialis]|uniref:hypothetical protein n=1 Tax=Acinetobacter nosocomialis TaxID=106654 RepID=UPI0021CF75D7|nr:hypothetical protein [Acinetobacter nosocomialis]MCU4551618.1 hypothetical protein [Acinetobacter nosocomialis]
MDSLNIALELCKLLTPFIIAAIVYLIWHKQKEKEVIANEAKELIKSLTDFSYAVDELYKVPADVYSKAVDLDKYTSEDFLFSYVDLCLDHADKLKSLEVKISEIKSSISFISLAVNDTESSIRYKSFELVSSAYFTSLENLLVIADDEEAERFEAFRSGKNGYLEKLESTAIYLREDVSKLKTFLLRHALFRRDASKFLGISKNSIKVVWDLVKKD